MKLSKSTILLSLSCIMPLISGCFSSYPSPIVPGEYQYVHDELSRRMLIIKPISEDDYKLANGIDVIEDTSKEKTNSYYSLDYFLIEGDIKSSFSFVNLKDNPEKALKPRSGFSYQDDNGLSIRSHGGSSFELHIAHGNYDYEQMYILTKVK